MQKQINVDVSPSFQTPNSSDVVFIHRNLGHSYRMIERMAAKTEQYRYICSMFNVHTCSIWFWIYIYI